jgi:hypothetical protein
MTQTTWATAADVLSLTDVTVTDPQLTQANAALELHAGRVYTLAADRTGSRDTEWMRRACAYQAAWMPGQPDVFTRLDYIEVAKETGAATKVTATAMTLAPLARKALARVSWLKSRSVHVRTPFTDGLGPVSTAIIDYDDGEGGF